MKILIIGAGGREHALACAYSASKRVSEVFIAPGNDFMEESHPKIRCAPSVSQLDISGIVAFVKKHKIDLVDVAQDEPLAIGVVDSLQRAGVQVFGPIQRAAEVEWNKAWSRAFMEKYSLPIPSFVEFRSEKDAFSYISKQPEQTFYIKAAGLAAGKGAVRAESRDEAFLAISSMKQFGEAGKTFLIEEAMEGEEFSLFAMCDGTNYVVLNSAQDHKTAYTGDVGPNTGGMGCVAPCGIVSSQIVRTVEKKILTPFMKGMHAEGREYTGILYVGGMITKRGVKIVEFNARWGDPEAQVILSGLKNDYLTLVEAAIGGKLEKVAVGFDKKVRISVAGCSRGYPGDYRKAMGTQIYGIWEALKQPGIQIYGAGIKRSGKKLLVNGGRVFHLVAEGKDIADARSRAYSAMSQIYIEGNSLFYRTDIGWREAERRTNEYS
jgi:phosphoribosylamine---glycine ligase